MSRLGKAIVIRLRFIHLYNHQRNIVLCFLTFGELIDFIVYGIEDIIGARRSVLANNLFKAGFAKHGTLLVKGFPDAVGADGYDLPVCEALVAVFRILKGVIDPQRYAGAF